MMTKELMAGISAVALAWIGFAGQRGLPTGISADVMSDAYWKIWNDAAQAQIDADIEANRKGDCEVEVVGRWGEKAPEGTEVSVEQIASDFRFGAHIFNFNQLGSKKCNDAYKASYGKGGLFNQATVSFYWIDHEPTPGAFRFTGDYTDSEQYWNSLSRKEAMRERFWRRPAPGPVIDFLRAKDVAVHGHILIWGNAKPYWIYDWYCPENEKRYIDSLGVPRHSSRYGWEPCGQNFWAGYMRNWINGWRRISVGLSDADRAAKAREIGANIPVFAANMRKIFRKRVFDVAAAYGAAVDSFDVVNESCGDAAQYASARSGLPVWLSDDYGLMPGDYPLHALLDAKEAFPETAKFVINDYRIDDRFLNQVGNLTKEGARIDLVGCQMHIFNTNDSMRLTRGATDVRWVGTPVAIKERLDMMAKTGRPLHVSEVTIAAPGEDPRSRQIQAVLARNIYRAWFSHPKTMGITWWNTVDGAAVDGEPMVSGLFTRDLEKKPVYEALDELINKEWKTRLTAKVEKKLESGVGKGVVKFRGFKGRYRLTWKGAKGEEQEQFVEVK